jgi:hypothetical protein
VEFHVTNTGGVATGPLAVNLPQAAWMSLATASTLP